MTRKKVALGSLICVLLCILIIMADIAFIHCDWLVKVAALFGTGFMGLFTVVMFRQIRDVYRNEIKKIKDQL